MKVEHVKVFDLFCFWKNHFTAQIDIILELLKENLKSSIFFIVYKND